MSKNYIISEEQLQKIIENIEPSKTAVKNICDSEKFCKSQGKITFGQLKALVESATKKRIFKHVGEGGVKATIRVLPWFVPQLFIPGMIAASVRAINKILTPSLTETENYKTFWGKVILKSFKIAEGEINLSDPLSKIFFISDGLLTMMDDKYKVKFAKYIANLASNKPNDEEVPDYFVENELRKWVNDKFLLNPPIPPKISDSDDDNSVDWENNDELALFEEEDNTKDDSSIDLDFYKTTYNPDDKSIIGAYDIINDSDKMIEVLNIHELKSDKGVYMDGSEPYNIKINKVKLPKSQIETLESVEDKEGFNYIKIPYWLFKKLPELSIKRLTNPRKINFTPYQYKDNDFLKQMNDPEIVNHITTLNPDSTTKTWVNSIGKRYKPEE
jgi:hypothetical protein